MRPFCGLPSNIRKCLFYMIYIPNMYIRNKLQLFFVYEQNNTAVHTSKGLYSKYVWTYLLKRCKVLTKIKLIVLYEHWVSKVQTFICFINEILPIFTLNGIISKICATIFVFEGVKIGSWSFWHYFDVRVAQGVRIES